MRLLHSAILILSSLAAICSTPAQTTPNFTRNATVHDPSAIKVGERIYVYGSHGASAWTEDLMNWTQVATSVHNGNPPHFPNFREELSELIAWCNNIDTLWAPDVRQLDDGRYYYYYCAWEGRGYMGLAVSDHVEGPYSDLGEIFKTGESGYNANIHPNTIDAALYEDLQDRLWMVYGSYSGGIFIIEIDRSTGFPINDDSWGQHVTGGNHSRIEAPYMSYNPDTGYYYLWLSFGGLDALGGYNMRVARSTSPTGPFYDARGTDMATVRGAGSLENDSTIVAHGVKLMGNFRFLHVEGEPRETSTGYVSPGHNSIYHDAETDKWFNIFHTRFVGRGEAHEVRVHQVFFNEDDWPVIAPHRYAGETIGSYTQSEIAGDYKLINHGKDITAAVKESTVVELREDGSLGGASGSWSMVDDRNLQIVISGETYKGVVCRQWDNDNRFWVNAFTALSADGTALWGSEVAILDRTLPLTPPDLEPVSDIAMRMDETLELQLVDRQISSDLLLEYELLEGPAGMTVGADSGLIEWIPPVTSSGRVSNVRVRARDAIETEIADEIEFSVYVGATVQTDGVVMDFDEAADSGIVDSSGDRTGLTARLSGTGTGYAASDPNLDLDAEDGRLLLKSTRSDFNGQSGVDLASAVGRKLSEFGYTGAEDFVVSAEFGPLENLQDVDQVGVFVGSSATTLTRAGIIMFASPEGFGAHTQSGSDTGATFNQSAFNLSDGLSVVVSRQGGQWSYLVDGVSVNPQTPNATFLDGLSDLTVGVFAVNPTNSSSKTISLKSFSTHVVSDEPALTRIQQWRTSHFGEDPAEGLAGNADDPDQDGIANLLEYAQGTDPMVVDVDPHAAVEMVDDTLIWTFNQIDDPSLTYEVRAKDALPSAESETIWRSAAGSNQSGPVKIEEPVTAGDSPERFLRLSVESVE